VFLQSDAETPTAALAALPTHSHATRTRDRGRRRGDTTQPSPRACAGFESRGHGRARCIDAPTQPVRAKTSDALVAASG